MIHILIKAYHIAKFIFSGLIDTLSFGVTYLRESARHGKNTFPYSSTHCGERVSILANGPSLKEELQICLNERTKDDKALVVNNFACSEYFEQIKPEYYCLADPQYNDESQQNERTIELMKTLNDKVNWAMVLYTWKSGVKAIGKYITNPNIKVVGIPILLYSGFECYRYSFWKKGWAVPSYVNVSIMGIYVLLNQGFTDIRLYGVDHSFLANICTDDDNDLCVIDRHFYGDEYRKIIEIRDGVKWGVAEYIYNYYLAFVEHKRMRGYADYLGAQIINCTRKSWIDAYTRIAQIEKQDNK